MARPYDKAIWQSHMVKPYGKAAWQIYMARPYGRDIWQSHMALQYCKAHMAEPCGSHMEPCGPHRVPRAIVARDPMQKRTVIFFRNFIYPENLHVENTEIVLLAKSDFKSKWGAGAMGECIGSLVPWLQDRIYIYNIYIYIFIYIYILIYAIGFSIHSISISIQCQEVSTWSYGRTLGLWIHGEKSNHGLPPSESHSSRAKQLYTWLLKHTAINKSRLQVTLLELPLKLTLSSLTVASLEVAPP